MGITTSFLEPLSETEKNCPHSTILKFAYKFSKVAYDEYEIGILNAIRQAIEEKKVFVTPEFSVYWCRDIPSDRGCSIVVMDYLIFVRNIAPSKVDDIKYLSESNDRYKYEFRKRVDVILALVKQDNNLSWENIKFVTNLESDDLNDRYIASGGNAEKFFGLKKHPEVPPPYYKTLPLPPNWDQMRDSECNIYFIDHNTKTTTYKDPRENMVSKYKTTTELEDDLTRRLRLLSRDCGEADPKQQEQEELVSLS